MPPLHSTEAPGQPVALALPSAPASEAGPVKAWTEPVEMLTYAPAAPDPHPLFLEKRVYQGSSGRVYPLPVIDAVETMGRPRQWEAIHLENESIRVMVLPELGGRIHVGLDKRTGYDFFYRQNVIKPALVGLAGPWISGGVEFNWPQHHRPATFMPVDTAIEREKDGSVTVWCSDYDPQSRMKGMHGVCLRPGQAVVELRVRLYNPTLRTQTFLWWANVAARVHERYRSFFPPDVRYAADHAKRALTEYPLSQGVYYGVDYGARAREGVPAGEQPAHFVPDGSYPANDLGWYANIPVPTSYMIVGSRGDFFGGYDYRAEAGLVAYANHHIAPGKKQWTWGNHAFGYAWDRNLTDGDGPYIELMAGVYTDNQPDFSFLAPGETKSFSQFWYPISAIGVPQAANLHAALRVEHTAAGRVEVHVQATRALPASAVRVAVDGREVGCWAGDLDPAQPLHASFAHGAPAGAGAALTVQVEQAGAVLLRYAPGEIQPVAEPAIATEPPAPEAVGSNDELYLTGVHLEQYRHPTRSPEPYWREALRRDGGDSRAHLALGRWHLGRGELRQAEEHLRQALARLTARNGNPPDGETHYTLGLVLGYTERLPEAYDALYKSTWNAAWRGPAFLRLAELDLRRGEWALALEHLDRSLGAESENLLARGWKAWVLRRLGRGAEADALLAETQELDALEMFGRWLRTRERPRRGQDRLDLALELARAGQWADALAVVADPLAVVADAPEVVTEEAADGSGPMLLYLQADLLLRMGREEASAEAYARAVAASSLYVFPHRLEEMLLLQRCAERHPEDARAHFYLGNLLYDRRRHREAVACWERAVALDPAMPTAWRNLGIARVNVEGDAEGALRAFERARALAPGDARILYEYDQLLRRTGASPGARLELLAGNRALVDKRDNLSLELASLYNSTGQPALALVLLRGRAFQPWEGGEGLVLGEYVRAHVLLAVECLRAGQPAAAVRYLEQAGAPPDNLAEAKHLHMNLSVIDYWLGEAYAALGDERQARVHWGRAAATRGDFQQMQVQPVSETTYWSALGLRRLGEEQQARGLLERMAAYAGELAQQTPAIDYFATSLPAMLLFDEDLRLRQQKIVTLLRAQAHLGLGEQEEGMRLLRQVRAMENTYAPAVDLLRSLEG